MSSSTSPQSKDRVGAAKSFDEFIESYSKVISSGSDFNPKNPEDIRKVWEGGGKPFIKQYKEGGLTDFWTDRSDETSYYGERAFFTQGETFPVAPDTLHIQEGNLHEMVAEMSHAYDYNIGTKEREELKNRGSMERYLWGEDAYGKSGVEYYTDEYGGQRGRWTEKYPTYSHDIRTSGLPFTDRYLNLTVPFGKTTMETYVPGVSKQEDMPSEFHAHSVTEKALWEQLPTDYDMRQKTIAGLKGQSY